MSKSVRPLTNWSVLPVDMEVMDGMEGMEVTLVMEGMEVNIAPRFQSRAATRCRCRSQLRNASRFL